MKIRIAKDTYQSDMIRSLGPNYWRQVQDKISKHPNLSVPLKCGVLDGCWRITISKTRVVYVIEEPGTALIVAAGPRKEIYERAEGAKRRLNRDRENR